MNTTIAADSISREAEARRIALLDGHDIHSHADDWTWFDLNDDLEDDQRDATWRTTFMWESFRFEGHVYDVRGH